MGVRDFISCYHLRKVWVVRSTNCKPVHWGKKCRLKTNSCLVSHLCTYSSGPLKKSCVGEGILPGLDVSGGQAKTLGLLMGLASIQVSDKDKKRKSKSKPAAASRQDEASELFVNECILYLL